VLYGAELSMTGPDLDGEMDPMEPGEEGPAPHPVPSTPHGSDHPAAGRRPGRPPSGAPDAARRGTGQRLEEAGPLLFVAGACIAVGLAVRFTGGTGPVPQLPIWALFLALGLVASLGAGFSMIDGEGGGSASPSDARPASPGDAGGVDRRRPRGVVHAGRPSPRIAPADLVSLFWESSGEIMAKQPSARPAKSRPTTTPNPAPPAVEPAEAVIADLDRLLDELRPVRARRAVR
jgi:hypothetical protein